jgi:DNA-binding protein HU-beta
MKKNELTKELAVSESLHLSTATKAIDGALRIIKETIAKGDSLILRGFGVLMPVDLAPKTARNINTGETVIIPAHKGVKFRPSQEFKELLNNNQQQ